MAETRELVERARLGDAQAYEALVRGHYRAAYATALALTGTPMDAEDVMQDAFIRALERLEECDPDRFGAWLLTIVRNRAHNVRDRERVRAADSVDGMQIGGGDPAHRRAERLELRASLEAALAMLSPVQREIVLLHDLEGWKHREIAEALDMSEVMARQHLFKARQRLREQLGRTAAKEYLQ